MSISFEAKPGRFIIDRAGHGWHNSPDLPFYDDLPGFPSPGLIDANRNKGNYTRPKSIEGSQRQIRIPVPST